MTTMPNAMRHAPLAEPRDAPAEAPAGLPALEARLRQDLDWLVFEGKDWVPPRDVAGERVRDVIIIGAGMCGLVASLALKKHGIHNHVVYDSAPEGKEGPWVTIARMETLRSPKQLTGPAYGLPALTFRAWYEAQFGQAAWDTLFRIPRKQWMDYLVWYRRVTQAPVENDTRMVGLEDAGEGLMALTLERGGEVTKLLTRRLVLATGRDGLGGNIVPPVARSIPSRYWAHSGDEIDFSLLKGKRVAVIGAGASAMDNAAEALEAGCARMDLFLRRPTIPTVNKMMGIGSPGMTHGFGALPPEWKWKLQLYGDRSQTPPPRNSTQRVSRHGNAYFHTSSPMLSLAEQDDAVRLTTPKDEYTVDFIVFCTGFGVDFSKRPELAAIAPFVKLWRDGYAPPAGEESEGLASSPDLGEHFEFREKEPGTCPMLSRILCFNFPATLSHGKLSGDIPAVSEGADRLARGLVRSLFVEDVEAHYAQLVAYDTPELLGDEWNDADAPGGTGA